MSQDYRVGPKPEWVVETQVADNGPMHNDGEVSQLLIDLQRHVSKETKYVKRALKFLNNQGVQSYSEISLDFDPNYQYVVFHEVYLQRGEEKIDKLKTDKINALQRESSMESQIYDGRLTLSMPLSDVRPGDILVYSYSCVGVNPLYGEEFFGLFDFNFSVGMQHISYRLMVPPRQDCFFRYFNGAPEPEEPSKENETL